jgi:hypothetical protein
MPLIIPYNKNIPILTGKLWGHFTGPCLDLTELSVILRRMIAGRSLRFVGSDMKYINNHLVFNVLVHKMTLSEEQAAAYQAFQACSVSVRELVDIRSSHMEVS